MENKSLQVTNHDFLIYTKGLNSRPEPWNNRYLGLKQYYEQCK